MNSDLANSITELEQLAADRPEKTVEFFSPNDFYGQASLLKCYCGLAQDFVLPAVMPHGPDNHDYVWEYEINHPLPNVLVSSHFQVPLYAKRCSKPCFVIGSPFYYAQRLLEQELQTLRNNAAGTIAFPFHSTHWVTVEYNQNEFLNILKKLPAEFQPVEVCLYWRDIQLGRHRPFLEAGFRCFTAGHMFDHDFLLRLARIVAAHRRVVANETGTCLIYSASMGLPVSLFKQEYRLTGDNQQFLADAGPKPLLPIFEEFLRTMEMPPEQAQPLQLRVAQTMMGFESLLSRAELRTLLEKLERECPVKPPVSAPAPVRQRHSFGQKLAAICRRRR